MRKRVFTFTIVPLCAASLFAQQDTTLFRNLDEVVIRSVHATKNTPMSISTVSKETLKHNDFGQDIPYLMQSTPSLIVSSDAGTGIGYTTFRVRGTDDNRINITVNGVPLNDSESQSVFWVNMPDFSSSVGSVQIQRGVGTSTNGAAAFGASIAMTTDRPSTSQSVEINGATGSFNTRKLTLKGATGLLHNKFAFDARYSLIRSDGYIDRAKADVSSYYASSTFYHDATMIKLITFGSNEKTNQAWNYVPSYMIAEGNRTYNSCGEYTENGITKYYDQTDNYQQQHYHLNFVHQFSGLFDLNTTLHYTHGKGYYEDYKTDADLMSYLIDSNESSDLIRRKWMDNDFYGIVANLTHKGEHLVTNIGLAANRYNGNHYGRVIWARSIDNLNPDHEYYHNEGIKTDFNAFIKAQYSFPIGLTTYADVQFRHIDYTINGLVDKIGQMDLAKKFDFLNPKAGIVYSNNGHYAYASYSVGHREPNRNNYTESPTEQPSSETLYDIEAGYSFSSRILSVGANFYRMDYDDQLIRTGRISEIGEALTSNIDDSYRMGIEFTLDIQPLSWLKWSGNTTFSTNKIKNFKEHVSCYDSNWNELSPIVIDYPETDIAFSPSVVGNSTFDISFCNIYSQIHTQWVGSQYLDNTTCKERSLDGYCISNINIGYTLKPTWLNEIDIMVRINNIFGEEYETSGWVASYVVEGVSTIDNRTTEDGLAVQAKTNIMVGLKIKL